MSAGNIQLVVPPVQIEVLGVTVEILEVNRYTTVDGKTRFLVGCRIIYGDTATPVFTVDCGDNRELVSKLKAEVSRFKIYMRIYPQVKK